MALVAFIVMVALIVMIAFMLLIAYMVAPGETAIVKYAKQFNLAEVVRENNSNALANTIIILFENKGKMWQIAEQ